jgi:hypothetical protein
MNKKFHDLCWLLSGGVGDTIRQRNQLKVQLADARARLEEALQREMVLEEKLKKAAPARPLPFIMLNTLPKSGSVFLLESLRRGLGIPAQKISLGYVPMDLADYRKLAEAAEGNAVAQAHLDANPTNLRLLRERTAGVVLHLRDPRQALLSWIHHVKNYANLGQLSWAMVTPAPTPGLLAESLPAIIDWHLIHHFPNLLDWIERWLEHAESGAGPKVLVSDYRDFHADAQESVLRILDFYDIPRWVYIPREIPRDASTHFRRGQLEEWREVFNPTQQKICAELMAGYPRVNRRYGTGTTTEKSSPPEPVKNPRVAHATGARPCIEALPQS